MRVCANVNECVSICTHAYMHKLSCIILLFSTELGFMHEVCSLCVGSCLVRIACYILTGRDCWSEMHDGNL